MTGHPSEDYSAEHISVSIYSKKALPIYEWWGLGVVNSLALKCPSKTLIDFYDKHISSLHLDVGVGSGYFLDKCKFPTNTPEVHLMDLNPDPLEVTAKRISRYKTILHQVNILQPFKNNMPSFDSIGLNYLLHCLPGNLYDKEIVFKNLKPLLNKNGMLFGATILGTNIETNAFARFILKLYNSIGIFSNTKDSMDDLEEILSKNFRTYQTQQVGCVALFTAQN